MITFRINPWQTRVRQETRGQTYVSRQTCVPHLFVTHELRLLVYEDLPLRKLKLTCVRLLFPRCLNFQFMIHNVFESARVYHMFAMLNGQMIFFSYNACLTCEYFLTLQP